MPEQQFSPEFEAKLAHDRRVLLAIDEMKRDVTFVRQTAKANRHNIYVHDVAAGTFYTSTWVSYAEPSAAEMFPEKHYLHILNDIYDNLVKGVVFWQKIDSTELLAYLLLLWHEYDIQLPAVRAAQLDMKNYYEKQAQLPEWYADVLEEISEISGQ